MRFKLYYMVTWVKQILEDHNGQASPVPEEIQVAMEKVMDFICRRYQAEASASGNDSRL